MERQRPPQALCDIHLFLYDLVLVQCRAMAYDAGPALKQRWADVSCFAGMAEGGTRHKTRDIDPVYAVYGHYKYCTLSVRGQTLYIKI